MLIYTHINKKKKSNKKRKSNNNNIFKRCICKPKGGVEGCEAEGWHAYNFHSTIALAHSFR